MATLSVRIAAQTASAMDRIIARTGKSKSEVVRDAIANYVAKIENSRNERPYDKLAPYIGSIDSGGMQLSTNTGRRVAEMLQKEWDERRGADRRRSNRRVAR